MFQDQGCALPTPLAVTASTRSDTLDEQFARLLGTRIHMIEFASSGLLEIKGRDTEGRPCWTLIVAGSARFTFANRASNGSWQVEANFDAGGTVRSSDRSMILAMCGMVVSSFLAGADHLVVESDDGRRIEVPYDLNEDGIVINIHARTDQGKPHHIIIAPGADAESPE
ncbi:hypothetical protein [Novosphingobium sp. M1R2S20]|uniref:Uncharacterized protein n=1 Tax=Novosphingobium rhizovicinum TaxID=3228928 RepID=A0ABV3R866_9SPHN